MGLTNCKWCNPREWGLTDNFEPACLHIFNSGQVPARLCRHKDCLQAATVPDAIEETPESQKKPKTPPKPPQCKCDQGIGMKGPFAGHRVQCKMHNRLAPDTQEGLDALMKQFMDFPEEGNPDLSGWPHIIFLKHPEFRASKIFWEREAEKATQLTPSPVF